MLDGLHLNPLGNAIMGIIACRYFSPPDPVFMDRSFGKKVREYLVLIKKNIGLPPKTKQLKI